MLNKEGEKKLNALELEEAAEFAAEEEKKNWIMMELSNFEKRAEAMYDSLYSLLSEIDYFGLFPQCKEKLKAIKENLNYAVREIDDIDYNEVVKKLEKSPADFWKKKCFLKN